MCLFNITGQIVCITQVKFAHPAIPMDQKWSTQCSLPEKKAIQSMYTITTLKLRSQTSLCLYYIVIVCSKSIF